jgi:chemotaxis receptor (MCP) glutamine deamidase CheD
MGELRWSDDQPLKSVSLGGCVCLTIASPPFAGMVNIILPDSRMDPAKADRFPGFFADSGVKALIATMEGLRPRDHWRIALVGGAQLVHPLIRMGERLAQATRQALSAQGLKIHQEELGGNLSKQVLLMPESGRIFVEWAGGGQREL